MSRDGVKVSLLGEALDRHGGTMPFQLRGRFVIPKDEMESMEKHIRRLSLRKPWLSSSVPGSPYTINILAHWMGRSSNGSCDSIL